MQTYPEFIPVTIDKSHIITIGERMYAESIEFVRELVNNAYDADASLVEVIVEEDTIEIRDNGAGMDIEGLKQYFNIGSQQKLYSPKSPIYNRDRIGQFGIGKFATLSACKRFEVIAKKDDFVGRVIFDKEQWEKAGDIWQLPLEILAADFRKQNGTTVILTGLDRRFDPKDIEAKIIEGTPIKAPHFRVRINNHTVTPLSLIGHRLPFLEGTSFGPVSGEIIILPETASIATDLGIEIKVKQVTIKRELFGMETWGKAMARVRGEVNADFLPITSDRTGFIKDSNEYQEFLKIFGKVMEGVKESLRKLSVKKERKKKPKVKRLTPNAIIKRIKFGETGVSCVVDSFGEDGPEVFSEETTIYLNRDHPLYKRESAKVDTHVLNLARLITQEISLMKDPRNPRQAFERQSKLLRDAFVERRD